MTRFTALPLPAEPLSRRRSRRSIWVWLFDFVVDAGTSLWMSRSWKECRHLAPDVSILERVSVPGPGCIREGCMSCMVMGTNVSMSTYVSCAGMSRRTYGSCENCVYKEGCLPCFVFFFSSYNLLYSIRNINLVSVSSISSVSTVSPYRRRSSSAARLCPTRLSDAVCLSVRHVRLTLSVLVRHVRPTLSVSLSDTSVQHCPSPCPTRPSDIVRSCPTRPSDAVRPSVRHVHPALSVSVSRSHSRPRSIPVPVPVPPPASAPSLTCVTRTHSSSLENCHHYSRQLRESSSQLLECIRKSSPLSRRGTFLIRVREPLIILRHLIAPLKLPPSGVFVEMTRFTALPLPAEPPTQRVVLTALRTHSQILTAVLERNILNPYPRTSNHPSPLDLAFRIAAVWGVC